jgi:hypothetical protein
VEKRCGKVCGKCGKASVFHKETNGFPTLLRKISCIILCIKGDITDLQPNYVTVSNMVNKEKILSKKFEKQGGISFDILTVRYPVEKICEICQS